MNITSSEAENFVQFKRLVEGYLLSSVSIMGLIGNSITCISILSNRMRRTSPTDIFIFGLSFTSIFVLAGFLLTHGLRSALSTHGEKIYLHLFTRIFPAHVTCILVQIYLTAAISVDRFLMICHWHKLSYRKWRTPKRIINVIIGIVIFSIIYCLPFWFEHVLIDNQYVSLSSIGSQPLFRLLVRKYLYFIFVFLLPMSCIMICTISIVNTICSLSGNKFRNRVHYLRRRTRRRKINTLLLLIMIIFLSTQLPYFIFNVIYAIQGPNVMENILARQYLVINNLLSTINASTTFILYALFGAKGSINNASCV